jgi:3-phosphoshikimate 1-carboxyvinyltransferase
VAVLDPYEIVPFVGPVNAVTRIPGSKSITNRALLCAALADGPSVLRGVLEADDTAAMQGCVAALGAQLAAPGDDPSTLTVEGVSGRWKNGPVTVNARMSGTTARFIAPSLLLGVGRYTLDAVESMRERPMGDLVRALSEAGARVEARNDGRLPMQVVVSAASRARELAVPGNVSSQFLSGLLLTAPCLPDGALIRVLGELVSRPYVDMTLAVMRSFGASVDEVEPGVFTVAGTGYRATDYAIEPDASAASYAFGVAAIAGGQVVVPGLGKDSMQGDLRFAEILGLMGAQIELGDQNTSVTRTGDLVGVDVDMTDCSDTAQTFAVVAAHASGPSRVRGIGFIRQKETDRIAAVVSELRRCGVDATEEPDGFSLRPAQPGALRPAVVETYRDHRMAMSFALMGLRSPGISIADPGCVAKTFPQFFEVFESMRPQPGNAS